MSALAYPPFVKTLTLSHECWRGTAVEWRAELRHIVGFSVADEIAKLDQLKKSGSITDAEYGRLRAKLV